jgi:hypothetical protein
MNNLGAVLKAEGERVFNRKHRLASRGRACGVRVGGLKGDVGLPGASPPTLNNSPWFLAGANVSATRAQD